MKTIARRIAFYVVTAVPATEQDCPVLHAVPDPDASLRYAEGLLIGYRGYDASGVAPRYPFGHGLGYTNWEYSSLDCPAAVTGTEGLELARHEGARDEAFGGSVAQVTAGSPGAGHPWTPPGSPVTGPPGGTRLGWHRLRASDARAGGVAGRRRPWLRREVPAWPQA